MKKILNVLFDQKRLSKEQSKDVLINIAQQKYNPSEIAAFMTVFLMRPISVNELSGFRDALKELAIKVDLSEFNTIDIVGTGGDQKNTFNISTLASFIVAGTGNKVLKHCNYGVSSVSGASNMLEVLGYRFTNNQSVLKHQLERANISFLHAPLFHPAMKVVAPIRRSLGVKTFFNMLGPLVNPSNPQNKLLGVFNLEVGRVYNYMLQSSKVKYGIVYTLGGYDEISLTDDFKLFTRHKEEQISPEEIVKKRVLQSDIFGGNTVEQAAKIFMTIINGKGTEAQNNVALTNAAFALKIMDENKSFQTAFQQAKQSLFGLKAKQSLDKLISN